MFEKKLKDLLPSQTEQTTRIGSIAIMSEEERTLQHAKIDELKYIGYLLERMCWMAAPGASEFDAYRIFLRKEL